MGNFSNKNYIAVLSNKMPKILNLSATIAQIL